MVYDDKVSLKFKVDWGVDWDQVSLVILEFLFFDGGVKKMIVNFIGEDVIVVCQLEDKVVSEVWLIG